MEFSLVRMVVMLCLFFASYAMTLGTITLTTAADDHVTSELTTVAAALDVYTEQTVEETLLTKGVELEVSTTSKNDVTTEYFITKADNSTKNINLNETTDTKATLDKITTVTQFSTPQMTSIIQHSTGVFSTTGHDEHVLNTEGVLQTTRIDVDPHSTKSHAAVTLAHVVTDTPRSINVLTTSPAKETSADTSTTEYVPRTIQRVIESEADQKPPQVEQTSNEDEDWDWYDTQTIPGDKKPNAEISSLTKDSEEDNLYYNSPQYIQRRTINHAAVWITVGFVAILLTYILALFIHEKGRSEWKLATQNYSRFENEVSQEDDSSLTIDMDEPSTPFTVTSSVIETTSTQNLMLKPSVVNTRKSY